MTDDYKKTLLNYITELEPGKPTNEEIINEISVVARSKWENYIPQKWAYFRISGLLKSKTSDKIILYGGYVPSGETAIANSKGIIIITDQELNPIKTIYEYSSGTLLRPIQCLFQEEDGQLIGVDSTILHLASLNYEAKRALMTNQKRIIMLNDFSIPLNEDYQVILRTSYILGASYQNFICKDIYKNPTSSHYTFMGMRIVDDSKPSEDGTRIIHLKINVGSPNDWGKVDSDNQFIYGGGYTYYDSSDNANWKCLLTYNIGNDAKIYYWAGVNGSVSSTNIIYDPNYSAYIDSVNFNNQVAFIDQNTAYFVINNQFWGRTGITEQKYIGLFKINLTNLEVEQNYLKYLGNYDFSTLDAMFIQALNGELYVQYCDNVQGIGNNATANYYVQRFTGTWSPILIGENKPYASTQRSFYVSQTFNLLKMNIYPINLRSATWYMSQVSEIYNLINYNGEPYNNYNALVAKYGNVYSNDKIVFSRNLHNLSITNNYTVASIEIPNTYLNNVDLNLKELVGETNVVLVEDGKVVSKNIYEVLYLNYINTLSVKDNENAIKAETGRYINTNINVGTQTNYNNTKCTKVCINYQDETNKIFPIGWVVVDDTHKYTEFTINVDKAISNIELISNDETTTYITIERELEVGKYYTFKQYIKVE